MAPTGSGPERKHGSGLAEGREAPVYLWTRLGLGTPLWKDG